MSTTAAIRSLRAANVAFNDHPYGYEDQGGTAVSARELGVDEHSVIKTLVMEDEQRNPLVVLMHGDREVSLKALARVLGVKTSALRTRQRPTGDRLPVRRHLAVRDASAAADYVSGASSTCPASTSTAARAACW